MLIHDTLGEVEATEEEEREREYNQVGRGDKEKRKHKGGGRLRAACIKVASAKEVSFDHDVEPRRREFCWT